MDLIINGQENIMYKYYIAHFFGFIMLGYSSGNLLAQCAFINAGPSPSHNITLPSIISAEKNVGVGEVMASIEYKLQGKSWNCPVLSRTTYGAKFKSGNPSNVPDLPDLWSTGVAGVGMRITFGHKPVPWTQEYIRWTENFYPGAPALFRFELIRTTASEVGSGVINLNHVIEIKTQESSPLLLSQLTLSGSTKFVNNMGYSSCEPVSSLTNVVMSDVDTGDMELGNTKETNFNIDISCFGAKPNTPPPVNIIFSGASSWIASGLLGIKEEPGAASGVAIALNDKNGNKISFSPAVTKTDWLRSDQTAEIYRFSGKVKYVKSGTSGIKPGKANASVTYVISHL